MSDLMAVTLTLRPTHRDTIPFWLGRAARGMLLHSIEAVDPALSEILHSLPGDKPFTSSTLNGGTPGEMLELNPTQTYTLRYTSLAADLTRLMRNAVIPQWQQGIRLHDQPLRVESMDYDSVGEGGGADYQAILNEAEARESRRMRLTLQFETPTYFKATGQGFVRLPSPEHVFAKSLMRRWNVFSPVKMPEDLSEFITKSVEVETVCGLHTRSVSFERAGKNRAIGFVGEVTYYVSSSDKQLAACVWALARFAQFSGVGAQSADGLGQTRLVDTPEKAGR